MKLFELTATLGLDTSGFESGIAQAGNQMQSLGDKLNAKTVAIGTAVGSLATDAVKTAAKSAVQLAKQAVEASAEVSAENAQFAATFGDMANAAEEAYGKIGKETNILTTRLRATGTKGFAQLTGAGVSASEALDTSAQMLQLSADAAAYYDITLEAADERIRSFMRGNTEAGDAIGLFTSETQRNTRAMELYKKKWAQLTEAQRQNLMLNVAQEIYEQSGVIGQAAREGHEWLNVTQNLSESWRQTLANLGEPLKNALIPGIEKVTELLNSSETQEKIGQIGAAVGEFATEALSALIDGLDWCVDNQGQVESTLSAIGDGLAVIAAISFPKITALVAGLNALGVINLTGQTYNEQGELVTESGETKKTLQYYAKKAADYANANSGGNIENDTVFGTLLKQTVPNLVSLAKVGANEISAFVGGSYSEELKDAEIGKIKERAKKIDDALDTGNWLWKNVNEIGINRGIAVDMQAKAENSVKMAEPIESLMAASEKEKYGDKHTAALALASGDTTIERLNNWSFNAVKKTVEQIVEAVPQSVSNVMDFVFDASKYEGIRNVGNAYAAEAKQQQALAQTTQTTITATEDLTSSTQELSEATASSTQTQSRLASAMSAVAAEAKKAGDAAEAAGKAAEEAGEKADETKGKADEAGESVEDALNPDGEGISGLVSSAISALQELQAQAEETAAKVSAALNAEHGGIGGSFGTAVKVTTGGGGGAPLVTAFGDTYNPLASLTRHATGLPTVPFDGYLAMLHRGEAILTRREADSYRSGREEKAKDVTIVQNIQSVPLRPSELAAQTRHAFESLRFSV